jgi:hypothetical protein
MNGLIRRHVLRVLVMGHVEEATFSTEAAVDAMGEKAFHLSLSPFQHLFDLVPVHRVWGLLRHPSFLSSVGWDNYHVLVPRAKLYSLPIMKR